MMNMFARWLESLGQDPRTFLKDAVVFVIRFYVVMFVVCLPILLLTYLLKHVVPVAPARQAKVSMPQVWLFLVPFFIYMFCAVATATSFLGGWRKLAGRFPAPQNFAEGRLFKWQSGDVGVASYNSVLNIRVSPRGLYFSCIPLFRFMHPPILIPWTQVKVTRQKRFLGKEAIRLTIGSPKLATIALRDSKIINAAAQWILQS